LKAKQAKEAAAKDATSKQAALKAKQAKEAAAKDATSKTGRVEG